LAGLGECRPIRIGRNVWIGFDCCVLPGVTIGDGSIVGARSVVCEDVPPYTVVAGNPARVIRKIENDEIPQA
jgi:acetyltransferase-like isoleucine patch superfamily enzyme